MKNTLSNWKNDSLILINNLIEFNVPLVSRMEQGQIRDLLQFGLNIRLYIIKENIIGIYTGLTEENHLKLSMEINSFYFHLKGILDNLALIIHTKYRLDIQRSNIDLSKQKFRKSLKLHNITLDKFIKDNSDWLDEIKNKRDPIAHQKPLYVPPGIITTQEEYQQLEDINKKIVIEKNINKISELTHEWGKIIKFHPYMIQHDQSKLEHIEETILKDLQKIQIFNTNIIKLL